jgi:release factor glutamine methyltransferase
MNLDACLADLAARLAVSSESAALDAQVVLAHLLNRPRAWVLAHPETELNADQVTELENYAQRLLQGQPLPYLIGHWEFFGLDFEVNPSVLIPRPETEHLVEHALVWMRRHPERRYMADIGTGSGCIAISLAVNLPELHVIATDISPEALETARRNAHTHGVSGQVAFVHADLLHLPPAIVTSRFDLITANLPYIPSAELQRLSVSRQEPALALDGGKDGLDLIRRLLASAPKYLADMGCLLIEIEASQGTSARALAEAAFPKATIQVFPDMAGHDRLLVIETSPES